MREKKSLPFSAARPGRGVRSTPADPVGTPGGMGSNPRLLPHTALGVSVRQTVTISNVERAR